MSALAQLTYQSCFGREKVQHGQAEDDYRVSDHFGFLATALSKEKLRATKWRSYKTHSTGQQLPYEVVHLHGSFFTHPTLTSRQNFSSALDEWREKSDFITGTQVLLIDVDSTSIGQETINFFAVDQNESEEALKATFHQLASRWKEETKLLSSPSAMAMHPSYQSIIGLGPNVIPLVLRELCDHGGHWFWALKALTREDPVPPHEAGRIKKMTEAWLQWGKQKGYL